MFGKKKEEKIINRVKILGVRTANETGVITGINWNKTSIIVLVEYTDGSREVDECLNKKEFDKYIMYVNMD